MSIIYTTAKHQMSGGQKNRVQISCKHAGYYPPSARF